MLRALWFLVKVGALVAVIGWFSQNPGVIEISWLGYVVNLSVGFAVALVLGLIVFWTYLDRLWRAFVSMPEAIRRHQAAARREKGYRILTSGLVAVAAGDAHAAEKSAHVAEKLIPGTPLTKLLTAQTALLNGNAPKARRAFVDLLEDGEGAFFGLRGLLTAALKEGDDVEALTLIRRAEEMQPRRHWIIRTRFDLEARNRLWDNAEAALKKGEKLRAFDTHTARRYRQAILTARAQEAAMPEDALRPASRAFAIDAGFTPAAVMLAKAYLQQGKQRAALKTLEKAWRAKPHPVLAQLWRDAMPASKKPASVYDEGKALYKWMKKLTDENPNTRESHRAAGAAALDGRLWKEAREHLKKAADYRLLARLEQAETGNEADARVWLEMAADYPPEPKWVCQSCAHAAEDWNVICPTCKQFGTAEWVIPGENAPRAALPAPQDAFEGDIIQPPVLS